MAQDSPSRHSDQYPIRLPDGMRDQIKAAAKSNGRSMNAEMVARIQNSALPNQEPNEMAKGNALTIRLSDETREKLDRLSMAGPYRISLTSIVERGIELAALELEAMNAGKAEK